METRCVDHRQTTVRARRSRSWAGTPGAFSLVELLSVIGVICVLMAVLIPSVRKSLRRASATVCKQHLSEVYQSLRTYRLDNRGWLPDVQEPTFGQPVDPYAAAWFGRLFPRYIAEPAVLICPADPARSLIDVDISLERRPDPANASSYGLNDVIRSANLFNLDRYGSQRPSETILLADLGPDHPRAVGDAIGGLRRSGGRLPWDDLYHPAVAGLTYSWLTARHSGTINVLSVGGAVTETRTVEMMAEPIRSYYGDCSAGGCPLCLDYSLPHYSFANWRLYWWTGRLPENE